jgi:aerobic-type carbon monoxide dehydrogenase small subunit (CoxS/CutS family)
MFQHAVEPSDAEILDWVSGNLCRCGCYKEILAAANQAVSRREQNVQTPDFE